MRLKFANYRWSQPKRLTDPVIASYKLLEKLFETLLFARWD